MSTSKTARASAVKTVGEKKAVIPDAEMIRILRINLDADIWTANQDFTRALVREHDRVLAIGIAAEEKFDALTTTHEETSRQLVLAQSINETLRKTVQDMNAVVNPDVLTSL